MRAIGSVDSAQKRGKSAKICEFSGKFIHSFSRNLVLEPYEREGLMTKRKPQVTKQTPKLDLLDADSAMEAIETLGGLADQHGIDWALAGELAVILYGSDRLTKDVDVIAAKRLPLESRGALVQGGERYEVAVAKRIVAVDWITRSDEARRFYQEALNDAVLMGDLPILTPEWLVILKYLAGRFKDQEDAVFLLSQKDLVDRAKIRDMIVKISGIETWAAFKAGLQRWYDLADGKSSSLKPGYIDS
jgi:hypothetical protein